MKIAVIGTGISGNTAAYHLSQSHDVTVFEANDYIGGHTHTHDIEWQGTHYAVDSGFIVFNERTYPNLIALLDELKVSSLDTEMSFSVKDLSGGLEYNGHNLNTLFAQRRNLFRPSFYWMLTDILRFNREAPQHLETAESDYSLGEYLKRNKYSREFAEHYIIPMGAAIWSTDQTRMKQVPAKFFIRFFDHHGLLQIKDRPKWFVIKNGSHRYVEKLTESFQQNLLLSTPVESIRRFPDRVEVKAKNRPSETFDAVFIAAHSDQALRMLDDPSQAETSTLGAIKYQSNEAILHTDERILPKRKRAWAAWNYQLDSDKQRPVNLTNNMNILQHLEAPVQFCVTLNNTDAVDPAKIIKRMEYAHPIFCNEAIAAQARQAEINGVNRTFYCGAYWRNGFHEDGVVSALNALEHFKSFQEGIADEQLHLRRAG